MELNFIDQLRFSNLFRFAFQVYRRNFFYYFTVSLTAVFFSAPFYWLLLQQLPKEQMGTPFSFLFTTFSLQISELLRSILVDALVFLGLVPALRKTPIRLDILWLVIGKEFSGKLLMVYFPILGLYSLSYFASLPFIEFFSIFFLFSPFFLLMPLFPSPWKAMQDSFFLVSKNLLSVFLFQFFLFLGLSFLFLGWFFVLFQLGWMEIPSFVAGEGTNAAFNFQSISELMVKPSFYGFYVLFYGVVQPFRSLALAFLFLMMLKKHFPEIKITNPEKTNEKI